MATATPRVRFGSRVDFDVGDRTIPLRVLTDNELTPPWSVRVLGPVAAIGRDGFAVLAALDGHGVRVREAAHLSMIDGSLVLRSGHSDRLQPTEPMPTGHMPTEPVPGHEVQRRSHVRGALSLPLRGAALTAVSGGELADVQFAGATVSVSAGGLSMDVSDPLNTGTDRGRRFQLGGRFQVAPGARLYVELELPGELLMPTVLAVVEHHGELIRGRFIDVAPADRERVVRLIFAEHRRELAARHRRLHEPPPR